MHRSALSLVCCLFLFLSYQEEIEAMPNGSLDIVLTDGVAITRALPDAPSDELRQQFTVELLRDRDGTIVPEYKGALRDFGDQRVFKVGGYQLKVYLGENPALELDAPYYYGEVQDIAIEKGKATTVSVGCKIANAPATFEIVNREAFGKRLKDYYIKVTIGGESVMQKLGDITHPCFKAGGRAAIALIGTSVGTGQEGSHALNSIETMKAGVKYSYKLSMKASNVGFEVTTEAQQGPVTINETVPDSWLPKAKVFSEDFDENHVLTYTKTADALSRAGITCTTLHPVQNVEFTLNFADKHLEHLDKTYLLPELSEEDRRALTVMSIALPDLAAGNTEGVIDFAGVAPNVLTRDGRQDTDSIITVRVKADDRWNDAGMYTVRTVKPVFKVGYYPGNIWTEELTLNTLTADSVKTGSLDKFTDIAYEFSADGNGREAMPGGLWKAGLGPGTSYYVRAKYRGEMPGEKVKMKTYPQTPLKNGNLEGATVSARDDSGISRGAVYGWGGWATLSRISTPSGITAYSSSSRSGCRPTDDGHVDRGVRVIILGYIMGGFAKPKVVIHNELYLGTNADDNGNRECDVRFNSRPTVLDVWYKCISDKGSDVSLIKVQLLHDDIILGKNSFIAGAIDSYQYSKLMIDYSEDLDKIRLVPNKLSVLFKSDTKEPLSVDDLKRFIGRWGTTDKTTDAVFRGNGLFIDDVELIYDK